MNAKLDLKKIEKISKALGDPYRLKIMEMIRKKRDCIQCTALVETIDLAQSTVSHHMKQLVEANLVVAEKDGRNAKYTINQDVLDAYIRYLNLLKS